MDDMTAPQKVKPQCIGCPLVAGCNIGHESMLVEETKFNTSTYLSVTLGCYHINICAFVSCLLWCQDGSVLLFWAWFLDRGRKCWLVIRINMYSLCFQHTTNKRFVCRLIETSLSASTNMTSFIKRMYLSHMTCVDTLKGVTGITAQGQRKTNLKPCDSRWRTC